MPEVIPFDVASTRPPHLYPQQTQHLSYETYAAYQQAESAFRALYFGRPLDCETLASRSSTKLVKRHWKTVEQLAETLLYDKSLSQGQVSELLQRANLGAAAGAEL